MKLTLVDSVLASDQNYGFKPAGVTVQGFRGLIKSPEVVMTNGIEPLTATRSLLLVRSTMCLK